MRFAYAAFSALPPPAHLGSSAAAALWYQLDGPLTISHQGQTFLREEFPLFRLAALLHHWLAYRPAPLDESRLALDDFRTEAALVIRRAAPGIALSWVEAGRELASVTVLETAFTRAG